MFICTDCQKKYDTPWGPARSYGPCEYCKKTRSCLDIPSNHPAWEKHKVTDVSRGAISYSLLQTIIANLDNTKLSDAEFKQFVRNSVSVVPGIFYEKEGKHIILQGCLNCRFLENWKCEKKITNEHDEFATRTGVCGHSFDHTNFSCSNWKIKPLEKDD